MSVRPIGGGAANGPVNYAELVAEVPNSDEDLALSIQAGNAQGLADLFDRYGSLAFALALRILRDREAAEDVVQEAFLNVWRRSDSFAASKGSLRTWLLTVVRNRALDRIRSNRLRVDQQVPIEDAEPTRHAPDVWGEVSRRLDRAAISSALKELPSEQRDAIELAFFSGLTHTEMAERLDLPLGTVKGRLRLGLLKLRALLNGYEERDDDGFGQQGGLRVMGDESDV